MTTYSKYFDPGTVPGVILPTKTTQIVNPIAPYKATPTVINPVNDIRTYNTSKPARERGLSNVIDVFKNIITLQPIQANTGNPTTDIIVGATSQSLGTAALGFGALGLGAAGVDYVAGSVVAASAGKLTSSIAGKGLPSWLVPAGIGAGLSYLVFGKGTSQTAAQNTNPTVTPTQTTNPSQPTNQNPNTNPTMYIPGSNNVVYQDTYSYSQSSSTPTQNTLSYQLTNTTTNANQTTTQSTGIDPLILVIGAVAFLLLKD
jgi:hypothetical protein